MTKHVLVIGGGFSGTLVAVQAVRRGARVTLLERAPQAGRGLAYGAAHASHLLNVRAASMSALADAPDHFVHWLEAEGQAAAGATFARRQVYGAYLQDLLRDATASAPDRLSVRHAEATNLHLRDGGVTVELAHGDPLAADAAVLATGNQPPHRPRGLDPALVEAGLFRPDPWADGVAEGLGGGDTIFIVGTGLTMVDITLLLDRQGFGGRIVALSRRGLLPRPHAAEPPPADRRAEAPQQSGAALVREMRRRARAIGWRHAIDELRPFTQAMWRAATRAQQARFLRHLRPWWDVHRHRIAPEVHAAIQALIADGRLQVLAGKLDHMSAAFGRMEVCFRRRGAVAGETLRVARVINCTGPEGNLPSTREPLLRHLLDAGTIRPDPLGIGVEIDAAGRTLRADGAADDRLFALGPPTRGCLWEIVAVPDIRVQAAALAARLVSPDGSPPP